ncbi:hypothetical protein H6P81_010677 [Aristolochia fimbriata]|uniref:Uncharacterized protein n=1 Tax=Aristolochia fimbriata TaxID=158543 RepID=A0AAV7EPG5_ARIFI|nr:hypothetical protein H6P81_010677 [Aristolochia fimbriata]
MSIGSQCNLSCGVSSSTTSLQAPAPMTSDAPHLPLLERSLSLALSIYYPLAGRLVTVPDSDLGDRVIRYSDGDSVSLTLAESDEDFDRLVENRPKEAKEFHSLVPHLLPESSPSDPEKMPLVAFQVTVFPGSGVAIGIVVNHVVADEKSSTDFLKYWASIAYAGCDVSVVKAIPVFDRALVGDLERLKRRFLEDAKKLAAAMGSRAAPSESATEDAPPVQLHRVIRSTFVLTRADIEKIRVKISSYESPRPSTFVITCAYVLHCAAKTRASPESSKSVYFGFMADGRARLHPPVPATYFGNCIAGVTTAANRSELTGENGLAVAAEAIHRAIRELEDGILKDAETWIWKWTSLMKERVLSVAGSPRFGVYGVDFGWGRPRKVEIVSIEDNEAMSLAESRDGEGGIEIGKEGPEDEMLRFASAFEEGLRRLNTT